MAETRKELSKVRASGGIKTELREQVRDGGRKAGAEAKHTGRKAEDTRRKAGWLHLVAGAWQGKTLVKLVSMAHVICGRSHPRRSKWKGCTPAGASACCRRAAALLCAAGGGGGGRRGCSCGSSAGAPRGLLITVLLLSGACRVVVPRPGYAALMSGRLSAASSCAGCGATAAAAASLVLLLVLGPAGRGW